MPTPCTSSKCIQKWHLCAPDYSEFFRHPVCTVYLERRSDCLWNFSVMIMIALMCARIPPSPDNFKSIIRVTPTIFWLKCKNLPKCTKCCSTRKLEVAAKNFGLLTKNRLMHWKIQGLKGSISGNFCVVCLDLWTPQVRYGKGPVLKIEQNL